MKVTELVSDIVKKKWRFIVKDGRRTQWFMTPEREMIKLQPNHRTVYICVILQLCVFNYVCIIYSSIEHQLTVQWTTNKWDINNTSELCAPCKLVVDLISTSHMQATLPEQHSFPTHQSTPPICADIGRQIKVHTITTQNHVHLSF